jgi:hypothetical protein
VWAAARPTMRSFIAFACYEETGITMFRGSTRWFLSVVSGQDELMEVYLADLL